ncbi:phage tail protein [Paenibacillus turpanensis]|uniref:phage tail protein n=1 Tax=Paenibacillus turpanensis TaxID=2689078 RepID=UPI00140874AF|nr:phage tail protein [Paenibacillus turpanensis]
MADRVKFFSLNKQSDWEQGFAANMQLRNDGLSIRETKRYAVYQTILLEDLDGIGMVVDMTAGVDGRLYLLDEGGNLWSFDPNSQHKEALFRSGHQLFSSEAMIAAGSNALYIADWTEEERRVAAVSTANGQLLWSASEWNQTALFPLAITVDKKQCLYAVVPLAIMASPTARTAVPEGGRLAVLKWSAGEVTQVFEHELLSVDTVTPIYKLSWRYYIAAASDGGVSVLDATRGLILRFLADGTLRIMFSVFSARGCAGLTLDSNDHLFVGEGGGGGAAGAEDQYIMQYDGNGEFLRRLLGSCGRADKLIHDVRDRMIVLNRDEGIIRMLELQSRTGLWSESGSPEAVYFSEELDSVQAEMEWHKVWLEADIPEETQIQISFFASDERIGWIHGQLTEYTSFLKSPDLSMTEKLQATESLWSMPIVNAKDALLSHMKGRYLWFKIHMIGTEQGSGSPVIRKLRLYFPKSSLISYLPSLYQENENSFLERFLAIFSTYFDEMEEQIDKISSYFDPDIVSGEYLRWLGSWLAVPKDYAWEERKLRQLIKQAPMLYKQRGTRSGLQQMLQLYTGVEPLIIEFFQIQRFQESGAYSRLFRELYGDNPYTFCVLLPPATIQNSQQRLMIERIIDDQKPAYTEGRFIELQPWMYADMHTYLGINTYLSEPTLLTLDDHSSIPYNTVLIDVDMDKRIDRHTRLGLDSELE